MKLAGVITGCTVCYGKAEGAIADGVNLGIFTLLGCIVFLLVCFGGYFVYLGLQAEKGDKRC